MNWKVNWILLGKYGGKSVKWMKNGWKVRQSGEKVEKMWGKVDKCGLKWDGGKLWVNMEKKLGNCEKIYGNYGRKIKNFKEFEYSWCIAPQMKAKNIYNSDWAFKNRFWHQKIFIFNFVGNLHQNGISGTWQS